MNPLLVTASPHIRSRVTTTRIMGDVCIALTPAAIASVILFGYRAAVVLAVSIAVCVLSEWVYEKAMKLPCTIGDLSAVVTGMLLAMSLPVSMPLWQVALGAAAAIIVIKQLFGGIGRNFANPAVTARIILMVAFSTAATTWTPPVLAADAVSSATPLAILSSGSAASLPTLTQMFLGLHMGCLGETCSAALLLGGAYLLIRRVISWHTPVAFLGTLFLLTALLGSDPVCHLLSGGAILGAFFMATDYATTPSTNSGRLIFGVGCGLLTAVIRLYGNYPEGVSFAILLMNIATPYIARLTRPQPLGGAKT